MAYNTKKLLTDRNGDPIPQSYDSDGDRYVPSEIDARLKAIENQQQEILGRLDKPIDTQLTGSNVEDIYLQEGRKDLEPNETHRVFGHLDVDLNKVNTIVIGLNGYNVETIYYNTVYKNVGNLFRKTLNVEDSYGSQVSNRLVFEEPLYTERITLEVRNTSDEITSFSQLFVLGLWR